MADLRYLQATRVNQFYRDPPYAPRTPRLGKISDALRDNWKSIFEIIGLLPMTIEVSQRNQLNGCEAELKVTGTLKGPPFDPETQAKIDAERNKIGFQREQAMMNVPIGTEGSFMHLSYQNAEWLGRINETFAKGAQTIFATILMNAYTYFESMAEDLWVTAVDFGPKTLARNVAGADDLKPADDSVRQERKQEKQFTLSVLERYDFDLREKLGTMLRDEQRADFQRIKNIQGAYEAAFKKSIEPLFQTPEFREVRVLSAIRNVLAHNAGKVGPEFMRNGAVKNEPELRTLAIGDMLPLHGDRIARSVGPTLRFCSTLLEFVDDQMTPP